MAIRCLVSFTVILFCCWFASAKAQNTAVPIKNPWYSLYNRAVSHDGKWLYFIKTFDDGKTDGILRNTMTGVETLIRDPEKFELGSSYFFILNQSGELLIKDLHTGTEKVFGDTVNFEFDALTNTALIQQQDELKWLQLKTRKEQRFLQVKTVENIAGSPCTVLYSGDGVRLLNRTTGKAVLLSADGRSLRSYTADPKKEVIKLLWNGENGSWISSVDYYGNEISVGRKVSFEKDFSTFTFLNPNTLLATEPLHKNRDTDRDTVEIWSSRDKALKPRLMRMFSQAQALALKDIDCKYPLKTYTDFTTDPYIVFDSGYVLEISPLENYSYHISDVAPRPKIRLRNRLTDQVEMEVQQVGAVYPSQTGRYLLFFKDRDWYFYNVETCETVNITAKSAADFYKYDRLNTEVPYPVDTPGFSPDYRYIYLTSRNDIWKYDIRTDRLNRLTPNSGKTAFRIIEPLEGAGAQLMKWNSNPILKDDYMILMMTNPETELHEGLAILQKDRFTVIENLKMQSIGEIRKSKGAVSYVVQNASSPPELICYQLQNGSRINGHTSPHLPADFPKTEVMEWISSKGESTYATVVLPPGYSTSRKYPAIVRVYENEAKRYRYFEPPSYYTPSGFNRTLLAMEEYIVILTRISYAKNRVGKSAVEAVEETVNKVQSKYSVDLSNVGIIGHSFGGYETNYILTESSMFKAAVSGSGVTDIVSDYFTAHKMFLNANISRYTNEQFGFTGGFYELKNEYLANSPILRADRINTPLLLWSGKNDEHVEWRQSVEMFMALSSLKKEVRLLLFPDDPHVLIKPGNQIEATQKILQWFGYYLKNGEKPSWF